MGQSRKLKYGQLYRGFESHPLRHSHLRGGFFYALRWPRPSVSKGLEHLENSVRGPRSYWLTAYFMPVSTFETSLTTTLQDLLELQAPQATLLFSIGTRTLQLRAGAPPKQVSELSPPEDWLDSGVLDWLSYDGALLGLLHGPQALPETTLALLSLLLAAARTNEGQSAAQLLLSQLPLEVAWLDEQLHFVEVSRRFLELYDLSAPQVLGRSVKAVFPKRAALHSALEQALSGKTATVERETLLLGARALHLRSRAQPYYGAIGAGVLWSSQDVSQEAALQMRVDALLGSARLPTAILNERGQLLESSAALLEALHERQLPAPLPGQAIGEWPLWAKASDAQELYERASAIVSAQRSILLRGAGEAKLRLSYSGAEPPLIIAELDFDGLNAQDSLLSELLRHSPHATLLLGPPGERGERPLRMVSEAARALLGLEGQSASSFEAALCQCHVSLTWPDGSALSPRQLLAALRSGPQNFILSRPEQGHRYLEAHSAQLSAGGEAPAFGLYLQDLTHKWQLQNRLWHSTRHDPLTGLPNWSGLRERLCDAEPHHLLTLAIDDFVDLQAALGRPAGDHLLIRVAAKLHQWRKDAQVARLEQEYFALALPQRSVAQPETLAAELQQLLSKPMRAGHREVQLSVSVGISPALSKTPDDLLDQSRSALHAAQRSGAGRGGIATFDAELRQRDAELMGLESELRRALPAQLLLLLQPIVGLKQGRVQGAELLLRWNHPQRGLISPRVFLPLAARAGMMPALGEWLLAKATQLRSRWRERYPALSLQLNLSHEELSSAAYLQQLRAALREGGGLNIELSASSLLSREDHSPLLRELRALGCDIFVDEFGDGASSLTSLERFALSGIKLHPSFVARLQEGPRPLALLEGTAALAQRLNLQVIAVGVETPAQAELLTRAGCHAAQGFFYSPPREEPDFEEWLSQQIMD